MRRICGFTAMALLVSLCLSSVAMAAVAEVFLTRSDDYLHPTANFEMDMDLDLSDVIGITGVTVSVGSTSYPLTFWGAGEWGNDTDITFATLAIMKSELGGTWTIDIVAVPTSNSSSSTFTLTTTGLLEGDFFATATGLSPVNGATNVPTDTAVSWVDPTGSSSPYALNVGVESNKLGGSEQNILSLVDPVAFPVTSTNWQPTLSLPNDFYEFAVTYVDPDETLATALSVNSGSITWSASPFAPPGYPPTDPLILKASETIVGFTVPEPSASASAGAALGTLLLLARLRRRNRCLA